MDAVIEHFHITQAQLEEFTSSFVHRLSKYMQEALEWRKQLHEGILRTKVLIFQGTSPILSMGSLSYYLKKTKGGTE